MSKKTRIKWSSESINYMTDIYKFNKYPSRNEINSIATKLTCQPKSVKIFFQNKRQRSSDINTSIKNKITNKKIFNKYIYLACTHILKQYYHLLSDDEIIDIFYNLSGEELINISEKLIAK